MQNARIIAGWLAALVLAWAGGALAERPPTPRLLAQAQKQVDAGDFEAALITLQDALASPDNSNDELGAIYWRMGEVYVYMKRDRDAADAFERLLYLTPAYQPPKLTSPHVRRTFETAREAFSGGGKLVTITLDAPKLVVAGAPFTIVARVQGLGPGRTARLYYRRALTEAWLSVELEKVGGQAGLLRAQLPGFPEETGIEYYAEIAGPDRRRVTGEGSSLQPRTLRVARSAPSEVLRPVAPPPPVVEEESSHAWVWAVVGGVVIAGAAAAYFSLSPDPATLRAHIVAVPP